MINFFSSSLQARRRISSTVKAIIEERRRSRRSSDGGGKYPNNRSTRSGTNGHDFLEILLGVESLSEDEKVSFVLDSLLGGYETTSVLMAMLVHFLGQSPAVLAQLKVTFFSMGHGTLINTRTLIWVTITKYINNALMTIFKYAV